MFPEGMDMNALLQQAQAMQAQLAQAQEELSAATFTGTAGGDLVIATITGAGELIGLDISREAVDLEDLDSLSDLIIAAICQASTAAANRAASLMPDLGL